MQGIGGPDENRRGGFERGGWTTPPFDTETATFLNQVYGRADAFLFGRRTYEIFAGSWGAMDDPGDNPIAVALNTQLKDVASTTLTAPQWADTTSSPVALDALDDGRKKGKMKMEDLFEGFDPSRYEDEARHQWGKSEAFVESEKRTRRYTPDDWKALKAEQAAVYDDAHSALQAGQRPSDEAVMDFAERHRLSIDRWFYPCSHSMHSGLASMYESDDRFRQSIDRHGQGLTSFLAEAIRANAARHQD